MKRPDYTRVDQVLSDKTKEGLTLNSIDIMAAMGRVAGMQDDAYEAEFNEIKQLIRSQLKMTKAQTLLVEELIGKVTLLSDEVSNLRSEVSTLTINVSNLEKSVCKIRIETNSTKNQVEKLRSEVNQLRKEVDELKGKVYGDNS
jgi:chromosome segregation ATPase